MLMIRCTSTRPELHRGMKFFRRNGLVDPVLESYDPVDINARHLQN
ncbi:hypothetical protein HMPREF9621_01053, partial [Cutibacterium modestum HL037PA2]